MNPRPQRPERFLGGSGCPRWRLWTSSDLHLCPSRVTSQVLPNAGVRTHFGPMTAGWATVARRRAKPGITGPWAAWPLSRGAPAFSRFGHGPGPIAYAVAGWCRPNGPAASAPARSAHQYRPRLRRPQRRHGLGGPWRARRGHGGAALIRGWLPFDVSGVERSRAGTLVPPARLYGWTWTIFVPSVSAVVLHLRGFPADAMGSILGR